MAGRNHKIKGPLLGACLILCIACAGFYGGSVRMPGDLKEAWEVADIPREARELSFFSRLLGRGEESTDSSVETSQGSSEEESQEASGDTGSGKAEKEKTQKEAAETETSGKEESDSSSDSGKGKSSSSAKGKKKKSVFEVSPEAKEGVWTSSGSDWIFMIQDGTVPYSGWLHDVDLKTYYFGDDYYMVTGWREIDGNTYYFDLDGILQTGEVTIDGETYVFGDDGVLQSRPEEKEEKEDKEEKADQEEGKKEEKKTEEETESSKTARVTEPQEKEKKGAIALTFDDGPSDFTPDLLGALASKGAHATFFMVGDEAKIRPELPPLMLSLGMELGNHTFSHSDLSKLTQAQIVEAVGGMDQLLLDLTGQGATVVRPPYGNVNDTVKSAIATPLILWSVDTKDWESKDVKAIVKEVKAGAQDGAIILMHDIYETSVEAAIEVIPWLIEEGYELLTVHELAERKGVTLVGGEVYSSF